MPYAVETRPPRTSDAKRARGKAGMHGLPSARPAGRRIAPIARQALLDEFQEKDRGRFLHERVYRAIRHLIHSGVLARGDRLPASRALAQCLQISRNSVLAAVNRLLDDGWLVARRGSGIFVSYSGPCVGEAAQLHETEEQAGIPFSHGWASDIFSVPLWSRLYSRRWQTMPKLLLQEQDQNGVPALRKAIATHLAMTRGVRCSPAQVFVVSSIPAAMELAIRALGLKGKQAWVEDPCCQTTQRALTRSDIRVSPVSVDEHGVDVELAVLQSPDASAAFVTPACQAPTGVMLSDDRRLRLIEWAERSGAWIFEDDFNCNGDGTASPAPPLAVSAPLRTIYFNSFNHILFPGLRIAYLVAPPSAVDAIASARAIEAEVNSANQIVLADFIDEGYLDKHLRCLNACNAQRRSALLDAVRQELSDYLAPEQNQRGYFFICSLKDRPESEFLSDAARNNIAIRGMSRFELRPSAGNHVVLGFSPFEPGILRQAAKSLRRVLESR